MTNETGYGKEPIYVCDMVDQCDCVSRRYCDHGKPHFRILDYLGACVTIRKCWKIGGVKCRCEEYFGKEDPE